jgi:hypothetical protein
LLDGRKIAAVETHKNEEKSSKRGLFQLR